ncbi:hypothetical protein [Mesorhizobium sp. NPDC059025]|uniref:hypothetical protein n=1 Tax=unclassified Mesorhizobium TaxID=325217 RepID=UPI00367E278E
MPVILLTTSEEADAWMDAQRSEAKGLRKPTPDDALIIVDRSETQTKYSQTQGTLA